MFRKAARITSYFCFAFTACMLFLMFTPIANQMARPLVVERPELKKADIIVVLGGGVYKIGVLGGATNERLIEGITLFHDGYAPEVIFSGGCSVGFPNKILHSAFDAEAAPETGVSEGGMMLKTALKLGVPAIAAAAEQRSINTYENLVNTREYMRSRGLKTCILVTSPTHMLRAALIAKRLGMDFTPAPVADYTGFRTAAFERLSLFREALWEYSALALYRIKGYI